MFHDGYLSKYSVAKVKLPKYQRTNLITGPWGTGDPYYDSVVLLAPFNDTNELTNVVDTANPGTFIATAAFDNDVSRFPSGPKGPTRSVVVDGNSDWIQFPDSDNWTIGTNDFTIESHVRFNALPSTEAGGMSLFAHYLNTGNQRAIFFNFENNEELKFWWSINGSALQSLESTTTPTLSTNTWYHVAASRNDPYIRIFFNGQMIGESTDISGDNIFNSNQPIEIGRLNSAGFDQRYMDGWIDNVRFTNGIGRYTEDFDPPRAPYPNYKTRVKLPSLVTDPDFSSVVLLAGFDGADGATSFTEQSNSALSATFFNSAQIDTAQFVFGESSLLLENSTDDYVEFPADAGWDIGGVTGRDDFTIEFRIRYRTDPTGSTIGIMGHFINSAGNQGWEIAHVGDNLRFVWSEEGTSNAWPLDNAWNPSIDTWYAVAIVRNGNDMLMFVDGTQIGVTQDMDVVSGSADRVDIFNPGIALDVGRLNHSGVPLEVDGWMEEVRITKGVARYLTDYTIATEAFPRS